MQQVDLTFFVELGADLKAAASVDAESNLFDVYMKMFPLNQRLGLLLHGKRVKLTSSIHDLNGLNDSLESLEKEYFRDKDGKWKWPNEDDRDPYKVKSILNNIDRAKTVLIAELRTSSCFAVAGIGIFDVESLVNCAHYALDPESRSRLSAEVKSELGTSINRWF